MPTHIADLTGNITGNSNSNSNGLNGSQKGLQKGLSMRNRSPSMTRATTSFVSSSLPDGFDDDYDPRAFTGGDAMTMMRGPGVNFDSDKGSLDGLHSLQHSHQHSLQQGSKHSNAFSKSEKSFFHAGDPLFPAVKGSPQSPLSPLGNANGSGNGYTPGIFATSASNINGHGHGGSLTPGVFVTTASGMSSGDVLRAAGEGKVGGWSFFPLMLHIITQPFMTHPVHPLVMSSYDLQYCKSSHHHIITSSSSPPSLRPPPLTHQSIFHSLILFTCALNTNTNANTMPTPPSTSTPTTQLSPDKASLFEDSKKKGVIHSITPTLSPTERRQAKLRLLGTANNA